MMSVIGTGIVQDTVEVAGVGLAVRRGEANGIGVRQVCSSKHNTLGA